ncbi:MAG: exonuclease SbcCD subunit D C-terminal domain-containing protein [Bacteroidota bacterium]|nr:exonuclease SbcCD subunit D C-terminal domain-containing protein [Bacteroidota bacterium]
MKILHTADWHLGQNFYNYDREEEHQSFLEWLFTTLVAEQIDVLLVAGDVFDSANPTVASTKMFYSFLKKINVELPDLKVVITAGNHDSPIRLEMAKPLLEQTNIHLIGVIHRDEDKQIDFQKCIIPLEEEKLYCLAIPFLRISDCPRTDDEIPNYSKGIVDFYNQALDYAVSKYGKQAKYIAMGHLHSYGVQVTESDTAERTIVGGVEGIAVDDFSKELSYVALGHIHKAQRVSDKNHIRYSGSPIPLSFSEKKYKHQVLILDIQDGIIQNLQKKEVPVHTPLLSIPQEHQPLDKVLECIAQLPEYQYAVKPFVEIKVLVEQPIPDLKNQINHALEGKHVRLTRIESKSVRDLQNKDNSEIITELRELAPEEVLQKIYFQKYNQQLPQEIAILFQEVIQEVDNQ